MSRPIFRATAFSCSRHASRSFFSLQFPVEKAIAILFKGIAVSPGPITELRDSSSFWNALRFSGESSGCFLNFLAVFGSVSVFLIRC